MSPKASGDADACGGRQALAEGGNVISWRLQRMQRVYYSRLSSDARSTETRAGTVSAGEWKKWGAIVRSAGCSRWLQTDALEEARNVDTRLFRSILERVYSLGGDRFKNTLGSTHPGHCRV